MSKTAFTLIELLVIVAIVGIIGAILISAVGKARQAGKRAQYANNLRQIGIAWHLYLDDHNERFPRNSFLHKVNTPIGLRGGSGFRYQSLV